MERNTNLDVVRAVSIMLIVTYHCFAITEHQINSEVLSPIINNLGEIGVTAFFIMSGFGIYYSLCLREMNGKSYTYKQYMLRRCERIIPQYYFNLIFLSVFTVWAGLLAGPYIYHLITHVFFVHNWWISSHGSINGAGWALGVIFQFYLIAYPLYFFVKKHPWMVMGMGMLLSIGSKIILNYYILPNMALPSTAYFVYNRQLYATIDEFLIGMIIAKVIIDQKLKKHTCFLKWGELVFGMIGMIGLIFWQVDHVKYGRTLTACLWHNLLSIFIGLTILGYVSFRNTKKSYLKNFFLFVARNEYGIYLWHFYLIQNLWSVSPLFHAMGEEHVWLFVLAQIFMSIGVGWVSTRLFVPVEKKFGEKMVEICRSK